MLASEESDGLTSAEFRALTEELVHCGLRKSTAPSVPIDKAAPEGRIHPKASLTRRIIALPIILATFGYIFLRDARRGQSLGKRVARLMVVSVTTGRPCSARDSAFRSLVFVLTGILIPGVGWLIEPIVALVDRDGRRLGDRAAETQVIELSSYNAV